MNKKTGNYLIFTVISIQFILYLLYAYKSSANIFFQDQFDQIPILDEFFSGTLTFNDLWRAHLEHRILGYNIISLMNAIFFNSNTMYEIYLGAVCLLITAFIFYRIYTSSSVERTMRTDITFSVIICLIFSLIQWENIVLSIGMSIMLRMLFFLMVMISFDQYLKKYNNKSLTVLLIFIFFAILVFGAGYSPALILSLVITFAVIQISEHKLYDKRKWLFLGGLTLYCILLYAFYFYGIYDGNHVSQNTSILDKALNILSHPIDATKFIFVSIASSVIGVSIYEKYLSINFMIFFGFSLFVAYVYYIYCFFKNKIYERTIVPFLLIVYSFIIFVLILVARFNYGLDYGVSSRYTTDTQYGIIGLLWMSATMSTNRSLSRWNVKKIINLMLVAVVFIAYLFTNIIEWKTSPYRKIYFENLQQIALNYSNSSNDELSLFQNPNIEAVINGFRLLEKNHLNIFSENNKVNFFNEYLTPKSGWYEEENGVRWTKKEFEFLVRRDSITTFSEATISGYIPPEQNNVKMSILIDGQLTLEQAMDEGSFSIKLPLKPNVESNSIKIKLNSSFTPQKSGINNDIRELGVLVTNITPR